MQDVATELAGLDQMTTGDLAERYRELHGQPCRTRHRAYLIRKIAWRIQANAEGDLSERAQPGGGTGRQRGHSRHGPQDDDLPAAGRRDGDGNTAIADGGGKAQ